jgi:hypothetical protein
MAEPCRKKYILTTLIRSKALCLQQIAYKEIFVKKGNLKMDAATNVDICGQVVIFPDRATAHNAYWISQVCFKF